MRPFTGPLASRNFRLLLACDVISVLGTAIASVAVPFAVLGIGGSAADVGFVTASATVPVIVFLLLGGVVADRWPRQRVMTAANVLQALAQAGSAALVLGGQARVWELMALAAVRGTGLGFYFPAAQGLLPQTVPAAHLSQANAMDRMGRNVSLITGSAFGGVLVGFAGPGWGLVLDAVSYAVAALLRAGMRMPAATSGTGGRMLHELREGWQEFISRRWLWAVVVEFSFLVAILTGADNVLGPLAVTLGTPVVLVAGGVLVIVLTGAVLCVPEVRDLRRRQPLVTAGSQPE